jgi:ferric enterobactin receptor
VRTTVVTALLFCWIVLHAQSQSIEKRINEVFHLVPLPKALKTIQSKYDVNIAYDHSSVQNIIVDLVLTEVTISEGLERLLQGTPLTFSKVGENVIIVPRPPGQPLPLEKTDIQLAGRILAEDTDETLPNAVIRISGTSLGTASNDDGYYTILHIPGDTATIDISYMGYITQSIRVKDIMDPLHFDVRLKSDTKILNEVVLTDEYNQAIQVEDRPGSIAFNPKSLASLPTLGEQDLSRTMQLMPGVSATNESSSGMTIRGMHSSNNLVQLDGMTIYQQDHFFGAISIINADIVKDVRVQKGMFDARYGGRVSGVIDMTTKNGNAVKPACNFSMNGLNLKATAEVPISEKLSLIVGGRRSFTDFIQTNLFESMFLVASESNDQIRLFKFDEGMSQGEPVYYFYDVNAKLTYRPSTRDIVSLSLYHSKDKMLLDDSFAQGSFGDGLFSLQHKELTKWGNYGASLRWGRQWNKRFYSNVRLSDSKFFRNYDYQQALSADSTHSAFRLKADNSINDLSFAIENEWLIHDKISLDFGFSSVFQETDTRFFSAFSYLIITPDETIDESDEEGESRIENSRLNGMYASLNAAFTDKLTLAGGVRVHHYYNKAGKFYPEPRVTLMYKARESLNLKAAYGRSNQFISQYLQYEENGSESAFNENFWILADPDEGYPVITTNHISAGATVKRKSMVYDGEIYYKDSDGIIIDGDLNSGSAISYGLDLIIQKTTGMHKGWVAYSLGRYTQSHPFIEDGESFPSLQDQRHEVKVVNMVMLGNWNLSSTLIFGSGKPYPKYDVKYSYEDGLITGYDLILDYTNQSRLPAYFRLDLAGTYRIPTRGRLKCETGLSIFNVTNHENIKTRKIDQVALNEAIFTDTEIPPVYQDVVLLAFTPSFFIHFSF